MSTRTLPFSGSGALTRDGVRRLNALASRLDVFGGNSTSPLTRTPTGTVAQYRNRLAYREDGGPVSAQIIVQAAADLAAFAPFALGSIVTSPVDGDTLSDKPIFNSATPDADVAFGVTLEAIANGDRGDGLLVGLVPAQVNILSSTDTCARINSSHTLESTTSGYARILYKAGTSGMQWCLLALPEGGGMVDVTVVTAWRLDKTNHKFQVKTRTAKVFMPGTESDWTDITDANGGVLDQGVIP